MKHQYAVCCVVIQRWYMSVNFKNGLVNWSQDKMTAIVQSTFPGAFSWQEIFVCLILRVQLTLTQHSLAVEMTRHCREEEPLSIQMNALFTDANIRNHASMGQSNVRKRNVSTSQNSIWIYLVCIIYPLTKMRKLDTQLCVYVAGRED